MSTKKQKSLDGAPYDFRRPPALPREQTRSLTVAFETFARQLSTYMAQMSRSLPTISPLDIEAKSYERFIQDLPQHTFLVVCTIEGESEPAMLQLPVPFIMDLYDLMLGGSPLAQVAEDRDFSTYELSDLEKALVKDILQRFLDALAYGMEPISTKAFTVRSFEYMPQFVQALPAGRSVFVTPFSIRYANKTFEMKLMIPSDFIVEAFRVAEELIEPTIDQIAESERQGAVMIDALAEVPLEVLFSLKKQSFPLDEVQSLKVGSTLVLDHVRNTPFEVIIEGRKVAEAHHNGAHAPLDVNTLQPRKVLVPGRKTSVTISNVFKGEL